MLLRLRNIGVIVALAGAALGASVAAADDTGVSYAIHHHYVGPRPLGMGDAFVAVANDYNALFYNPAGLARRDDGEMDLFMDFQVSSSFFSFAQEVTNAQNKQGTDAEKQAAVLEVLEKQYGKSFGTRATLFSGILVRPKWGFAVIPVDFSDEETLHKGVGPSVNTTIYMDTTVAYGYGDDIRANVGGRLSWGVTGKFINRGFYSKSINFIELATDPNLVKTSDLREGYGVDGDIGFLYTPTVPSDGLFSMLRYARPTFGAVLRNVLQTEFKSSAKLLNKDAGSEPPEKMYRVLDVGTKWEYPSFWLFSGRGVMDVRDIMHPRFSLKKGLHIGFEFDWTVASWWKGAYRVGLSEGFLTAGASALFSLFSLDLVTYAQDVGTYNTPIENRIYALRANINW